MRGAAAGAAILLLACANMEPPPGAPPDHTPPVLLASVPDSVAVLPGFDDDVEFRFGEVISEGSTPNQGTGSGDLERLILLSPTDRVPSVSWKRDRITVKPAEGWRPNRVYRVELLPGVTDLRRNRSDASTVVTFSTGAPLPGDTLRGRIVNWTSGSPAGRALVLAMTPDSLVYRGLADSSGAFVMGPLPAGRYLVRAVIDQNNNRLADPREEFDSVAVAPETRDVPTLWTFPHDTVGPRITGVSIGDSLSAVVQFNQYLDPYQRLDSTAVQLLALPDSSPVGALSLLPARVHDSLYRTPVLDTVGADSAAADSAAPDTLRPISGEAIPLAPGDSARQALLSQRPSLFNRLALRSRVAWVPEGRYVIRVLGIRNVNGVAGEAVAGFVVPKPPPVAPPDSLARDSLAPDSLSRDSVPAPVSDSL